MSYIFVGGAERAGSNLLNAVLCSEETANPMIDEAMLFRFI